MEHSVEGHLPLHEQAQSVEEKALKEFKEKLKVEGIEYDHVIHPDLILVRFLRARHHSVEQAFQMFTAHLEWRRKNDIDNILINPLKQNPNYDLLANYLPVWVHGVDKRGVPVIYERLGFMNFASLFTTIPAADFHHFHIHNIEKSKHKRIEVSQTANADLYSLTLVEDMSGISVSHLYAPAGTVYKEMLSIDEANYPETLHKIFVINSPFVVETTWKVVKTWLPIETQHKVFIIGEEFLDKLTTEIDITEIPIEFGGKCTKCGGEKCLTGDRGGEVNDKKPDGTRINEKKVRVAARKREEQTVQIKGKGRTLEWRWKVDGGDKIKFKIVKLTSSSSNNLENEKEAEEEEEEIEKEEDKGESGEWMKGSIPNVQSEAKYKFTWDNGYSIWRSKDITYWINIYGGQEEIKEISKRDRTGSKKEKKISEKRERSGSKSEEKISGEKRERSGSKEKISEKRERSGSKSEEKISEKRERSGSNSRKRERGSSGSKSSGSEKEDKETK